MSISRVIQEIGERAALHGLIHVQRCRGRTARVLLRLKGGQLP
jgi:hypothetical protein